MMQVGEVFGNCENQDQFHPFGWLKVTACWHFDPAACAQELLAEYQHRNQRSYGDDVHPMDFLEQRLIIQDTHQEHGPNAADDPIDLLDMRAGEFGVHRGAANLHDPERADDQHEEEEQPIEIAI